MIFRQGDVLVRRVNSLPARVKKVKRDNQGRVVLALGEVTGHAHALLERGVDLYEVEAPVVPGATADAAERYLHIHAKVAQLVHEEHATLTIPQGVWKVTIQREYEPQSVRMVAD